MILIKRAPQVFEDVCHRYIRINYLVLSPYQQGRVATGMIRIRFGLVFPGSLPFDGCSRLGSGGASTSSFAYAAALDIPRSCRRRSSGRGGGFAAADAVLALSRRRVEMLGDFGGEQPTDLTRIARFVRVVFRVILALVFGERSSGPNAGCVGVEGVVDDQRLIEDEFVVRVNRLHRKSSAGQNRRKELR